MQNSVIDIGTHSGSRPNPLIIPKIIVTSDSVPEVVEPSKNTFELIDFPLLTLEEILLGIFLTLTFVFLKNVFCIVEQNV